MSGLETTVKIDYRPKRESRSSVRKRLALQKEEAGKKSSGASKSQQPRGESRDGKKISKERKVGPEQEKALAPIDDDADNQGFAEWLRSGDGVDTMRLFVLANSLLVLVTMAWPHMQETFAIIRELIFGESEPPFDGMLALLFRGVFFVGVVGWYSAGVWKMIDNYFKERFERYLQEEYQRNPKMHEDVLVYGAVDKMGRGSADQLEEAEAARLLDSCDLDSCPAGEAGSAQQGPENESVPQANALGAGAAGKEVARTDDAAGSFLQQEDEPPDKTLDTVFLIESRAWIEQDEEEKGKGEEKSDSSQFEKLEKQQTHSDGRNETFLQLTEEEDEGIRNRKESPSEVTEKPGEKVETEKGNVKKGGVRRRRKTRAEPKIARNPGEGGKRKKSHKKKIRTLTLTAQDFDSVKRHRRFTSDEREFDEFDEERNGAPGEKFQGDEDNAGIALADLPFKPAIDVYDLERLSGEEFCPLTLDDDPSCEETRGWP